MYIIGLGPDGDDGGRGAIPIIRLPSNATSGKIGPPLSLSLITPGGVGGGGANGRGGGGGGISLGPRPSGS